MATLEPQKAGHDNMEISTEEVLEARIAQLRENLANAKQAFINGCDGHKKLNAVNEYQDSRSNSSDLAAAALARFHKLDLEQKYGAYLAVLVRLKRIESLLTDDAAMGAIKDAYERLGDTQKLFESESLLLQDRATLQQQMIVCGQKLSSCALKAITAMLKVQADGSYIPVLRDKAAVTDFAMTINSSLEIHSFQPDLPDVLEVFQVLVQPFAARFIYHFSSRRPTNRLDKPEWFLQHILTLLEQYHPIMVEVVQAKLQDSIPSATLLASHEFIRALLPMLILKVQDMSSQLLENVPLIIHMIAELKRFDDTLRDDFGFCNRDQSHWTGVTSVFMTQEVFEVWCNAEELFVHERFIAITEDPEAFEIIPSVEQDGTGDIAANASATKIIDLVEAMTRKFAPVEDLTQRQQFKARIQSNLLNDYLDKICSSTDAFETLTSGFSGGFPATDVAGKVGLQRLCRQLSGVSNVLARLSDWHDDPFYIALDLPGIRSEAFQVELDAYAALKRRIETLISAHLLREFTQELRPYVKSQNWSLDEVPMSPVASTGTSSSQLIHFYESVAELFGYLTSIGSVLLVHRVYITVAADLDRFIMSNIISKAEFSRRGALQFKRDVLQIWYTFSAHVARPESGMGGISDALVLLSDGLDDQERTQLNEIQEIIEPSRRTDRETQRKLLRQAGITTMAPVEVRSLLQRKLFSTKQ